MAAHSVECNPRAAVRIGALASPREIVTSNEANLRARGSEARERERERERERDVRGLERAQATGNNSTAALAPQR